MDRHDLLRRIEDEGYGFGDAGAYEAMRTKEYPALRGETYLDHAASPPAPLSPVQRFASHLSSTLLSNPHSASPSGSATSSAIDLVRSRVLTELFGIDKDQLDRWDVVFTAGGATQGIRLVGEAWNWRRAEEMGGRPGLSYLQESHTSLVGLRGTALSRCSSVASHPSPSSLLRSALSSPSASTTSAPTLYTYPAQCNATGSRLGLRFCQQIKRADPAAAILVDSAAYSSTSVLELGSICEEEAPDFVVASAYKILGWPTSLGFLVVKRSSAHLLTNTPYFGGGSISSLFIAAPFGVISRARALASACRTSTFPPSPPPPVHESLEMGTPPFLEIVALGHALDWLQDITCGKGLAAVGRHAASLRMLASELLGGLRHAPFHLGERGTETFVEHRAFSSREYQKEQDSDLLEEFRVVLEPPGPIIGFTLLSPPSSYSPSPPLSASSFPLPPPSYSSSLPSSSSLPCSASSPADYRPQLVGHAHLSRLAVINGISLRSGGMCNTGVWANAFGVEDAELEELARRGRRCWDDEEFSPVPPYRPLGLTRISFGLSSTVDDVLTFVSFVKRFFVRTAEVAALEGALPPAVAEKGEKRVRRARLTQLYVYPIKSCAPFPIPPSLPYPLTPTGLVHDREFMLVSTCTGRALSQKRYPRMALVRPEVDLRQGIVRVGAEGMEELVIPLSSSLVPCIQEEVPGDSPATPPLSENGDSTSLDIGSAKPTLLCGAAISSVRVSSTADAWFTRFLNQPPSSLSNSASSSSSTPSSAGQGPGPVELRRLPPSVSRHGHFETSSASDSAAKPPPLLPLRLSNESPFLLVSEESVREVQRWVASSSLETNEAKGSAKEVKATAFRPNFVVGSDANDEEQVPPFWEDEAEVLRIGRRTEVSEGEKEEGTVFAQLGRCRRCLMVAIDQETGLRTKEPLASLSQHRKSTSSGRVEFGVHLHLRDDLSACSDEGKEKERVIGHVRIGDQVTFSV
ncbi:hypothetical protein JCM11251_004107 [Rhodosporidiobolus azoricus]